MLKCDRLVDILLGNRWCDEQVNYSVNTLTEVINDSLLTQGLDTVAADSEHADVVCDATLLWSDEVRQTVVRLIRRRILLSLKWN